MIEECPGAPNWGAGLTGTSILTLAPSFLRADGFKCGSDWTKAVFRCVYETMPVLSVPRLALVCVLTSEPFLLLFSGHCSPDRRYALVGSWDGALYIWDVDTGKLECTLWGPHW